MLIFDVDLYSIKETMFGSFYMGEKGQRSQMSWHTTSNVRSRMKTPRRLSVDLKRSVMSRKRISILLILKFTKHRNFLKIFWIFSQTLRRLGAHEPSLEQLIHLHAILLQINCKGSKLMHIFNLYIKLRIWLQYQYRHSYVTVM